MELNKDEIARLLSYLEIHQCKLLGKKEMFKEDIEFNKKLILKLEKMGKNNGN